jgi:hypothetical protein
MNTRTRTCPSPLAPAAALALAVSFAGSARAVETRADVETDHLDAADDGGPRSAGVLVHSLPTALGSVGVEVDVAFGANAALSIEGDWLPLAAIRMTTASIGVPLFPQRFAFHGFYVHPRLEWARASAQGTAVQIGGAAVLAGYEWTWLPGATIRLSGGAAYSKAMGAAQAPSPTLVGIHPELDAALGWIF